MDIRSILTQYLEDFINLIFPRICIHCNTILVHQEEHICTGCRLSLPKTNFHLRKDNLLKQKFVYEPKVKDAAAYLHFNKKGIAKNLIHELKYRNQPGVGIMLGTWYAQDIKQANWKFDMIIPVPLHSSKQRKRGFNQSEKFAEGLGEILKKPVVTDVVKRVRKTATQTRKSKVQRWLNQESVYTLTKPETVKGKTVLIVDDVLTTGATIGMMVEELSRGDVKEMYLATIAAGQ